MTCVLITGSEGLIGRCLRQELLAQGIECLGYDKKVESGGSGGGDILDLGMLQHAVESCDGVIHLAAVSRVHWGEKDPDLCWRTNVDGTSHVLEAAIRARSRPWVLFASSREVYGNPARLPVSEDDPIQPVNVYGRSKAAAEASVRSAERAGLKTAILRFASVYGSVLDHPDRAAPAFAKGAAAGKPLVVTGGENMFDFVHVSDTVRGIVMTMQLLAESTGALPPIHLTTGQGTTLRQLAQLAADEAGTVVPIVEAPQRTYDVSQFVGTPSRAQSILGWRAEIDVAQGMRCLVSDFQNSGRVEPTAR